MFYKQFSKITDTLNPEFVENFDYWLATLPRTNQKNITASVVSSRLGVKYALAESILKFAENQKILEKYYLVKCPDCDYNLATVTKQDLSDVFLNPIYCSECDKEQHVSFDDVYTAYRVVSQPDISEEDVARAIEKRLNLGDNTSTNFSKADSLANDKNTLFETFYSPSESAYTKFKELRDKLDSDYGKNTTAKGNALEALVLGIFNEIKGVRGTNDVETETNQFDCTCLSSFNTIYPSVFSYMTPYFIIECKNETKKPNNTYINKLLSIMDTNEAQLGIVIGRKDATEPCFIISREHYVKHMSFPKQQIVITFSDKDLEQIIDNKVNLLEYLEYKIFQVTANSPSSTYEMFCAKSE